MHNHSFMSRAQCCQNKIPTWQTFPNPQNGLLLRGFLAKSRPLADQNEHSIPILADIFFNTWNVYDLYCSLRYVLGGYKLTYIPYKVIKLKLLQTRSIRYNLGQYHSILTRSQLIFSFGRLQQPVADLWQTFYKGPFQNGLPADLLAALTWTKAEFGTQASKCSAWYL